MLQPTGLGDRIVVQQSDEWGTRPSDPGVDGRREAAVVCPSHHRDLGEQIGEQRTALVGARIIDDDDDGRSQRLRPHSLQAGCEQWRTVEVRDHHVDGGQDMCF